MQIGRWEGALFLGYYAAYTIYVVLAAVAHRSPGSFGTAMLGFLLPIAVLTGSVLVVRYLLGLRRANGHS